MKNEKTKNKKFLSLLLSLLMAASVTTAFASCGETEETTDTETDSGTEDEVVTEPEEDDEVVVEGKQLIINKSFDLNTNDATKPIVTSVTGWTRATNSVSSGTAPSSEAASGAINVSAEGWADLTTSGLDGVLPKDLTEEQAAEKSLISKVMKPFWESLLKLR